MAFVLQVIGALVLAFFILLFVGAVYFVFKLRSIKKNLMEQVGRMGGIAVPVSIELVPESSPEWTDRRKVDSWTDAVKAQGYMQAGDFRLAMQQGSFTRGFVHANGESMAAICQFGNCHTWIDYVQIAEDGSTLTATNVDTPKTAQDPPWKTSVREPNATPDALYQRFFEAKLSEPKRFTTDDFKSEFEASYRRVVEWQYTSGNINADHIEEVAKLTGLSTDAETEEFLRQEGLQSAEPDQEILIERYLEESGILASEWERIEDNVIVITPTMTAARVAFLAEYHLDFDDLLGVTERLKDKRGSEFFWALLQVEGQSHRAKSLFNLTDPAAEVIQIV